MLSPDERLELDPFATEVRRLRDTWEQRREIDRYAHEPGFDAQFRVLTVVHGWFRSSVAAVEAAYDDDLRIEVGPAPEREDGSPGFRVSLAGAFFADVELASRESRGAERWAVRASLGIPDVRTGHIAAHPLEVRQWTRARVHQVLLQLLAAFERARTRDPAAHARRDMGATGR